jgi:glycosyltransferase involved in cell wall biosynthesis
MGKKTAIVIGIRGFPGIQGGVEKHCEEIYPYLQEGNYNIEVLARKRYYKSSGRINKWKSVTFKYFYSPKNPYLESIIHSTLCFFYIIFNKPDLVHIHNIGSGFCIPLFRFFKIKTIITYHSRNYKHQKWNRLARHFLFFFEKLSLRYATAVITVCKKNKEYLEGRYNRDVVFIPNGVNEVSLTLQSGILNDNDLLDKKFVLFVGRITKEKGLDLLIKAFLNLVETNEKRRFDNWRLVIAGKCDHFAGYDIQIRKISEGSDKIVFTGFLNGELLNDLYRSASLFVLPSFQEGCSISLLEAMTYGLPCLVSDIPENTQFDYADLNIFRTGDFSDLVKQLDACMSNQLNNERNSEFSFPTWREIALLTSAEYLKVINADIF